MVFDAVALGNREFASTQDPAIDAAVRITWGGRSTAFPDAPSIKYDGDAEDACPASTGGRI
jgi:hypothetical protein